MHYHTAGAWLRRGRGRGPCAVRWCAWDQSRSGRWIISGRARNYVRVRLAYQVAGRRATQARMHARRQAGTHARTHSRTHVCTHARIHPPMWKTRTDDAVARSLLSRGRSTILVSFIFHCGQLFRAPAVPIGCPISSNRAPFEPPLAVMFAADLENDTTGQYHARRVTRAWNILQFF